MILTKKTLKIGSILLLCGLFFWTFNTKSPINGAKLKEIRYGMPIEQVVSFIGRPISIEISHGQHNIGCKNPRPNSFNIEKDKDLRLILDNYCKDTNYCCDGNRVDLENIEISMTYTHPAKIASHPMLWVYLDSHYRVSSVYARWYGVLQEKEGPIYMLGETSYPYINDELFNKSFK